MIELSLSETARRHGMSPSTLSKALKEGRHPKGYHLEQYAAFDGRGQDRSIAAFHFPDDYPFPEWSEGEEAESRETTKDTVESGVEAGLDSTGFNGSTAFNERSVESAPASGGVEEGAARRENRRGRARARDVQRSNSTGGVESADERRILTGDRIDMLIEKGGNVALANPDLAGSLMWPGLKGGVALLAGGYAFSRAPAQRREKTSAVDDAVTIAGSVLAGAAGFAVIDWAVDGRDSLLGQWLGGGPEPARSTEPSSGQQQAQGAQSGAVAATTQQYLSQKQTGEEGGQGGQVQYHWEQLKKLAPEIASEVGRAIQEKNE